jgi:hypothetical protein
MREESRERQHSEQCCEEYREREPNKGIGQEKDRIVNRAGETANKALNTAKQTERELNKEIGQGKGRTVNSAGRNCEVSGNTAKKRDLKKGIGQGKGWTVNKCREELPIKRE